jgi:hypothetical protein
MRLFLLSAALVLAASTAAYAVGPGWHGPGWYIVMNTPVKQGALYRGAYKSKEDCVAAKPADHGAIEYDCTEYTREPLDN